ncbi:hypothetical protein [Tomitella fengzijianii]|uniref:Uncharacterized protein n=1 Tax=Tomitella fengzijianii TaxID=2597660 RepID=A0A516X621_9ACTN|nr:hypothetical protein [Tomitella fengzijianii]QDQ98512.1 hypothetical protein FO059_15775 [Tomitella fengzijianii]
MGEVSADAVHDAPEPVCIGVGGRAGIGRSALVDALSARMHGRGPLTVGELPACNDPWAAESAADGAARGGCAVPVDIAVHMVLDSPAPADLSAIERQHRRGVPVVLVRARADEGGADAGPDAASGQAAARVPLAVSLPPGGRPTGLDELADCLSAGVGRILAARADAHRFGRMRAAIEGPDREAAERYLRSDAARRMRAAGSGTWAAEADGPRAALREAAQWRAVAAVAAEPGERAHAIEWCRRFTDRAVALGAEVEEPADG